MDKKTKNKINTAILIVGGALIALGLIINSFIALSPIYIYFIPFGLGIVKMILGIKYKDKEFILTGILLILLLPLYSFIY